MKDNIQPMFHSLYQHELTPVKLFMDYKQNRGREAAEEGRASETGGGREGGREKKGQRREHFHNGCNVAIPFFKIKRDMLSLLRQPIKFAHTRHSRWSPVALWHTGSGTGL